MKKLVLTFWLLSVYIVSADKTDKLVKDQMQRHEIPGLALTIIKNGKAIKTAGYGMANIETATTVTKHTVFEIGSVTKQFTASGIMLLVQEGKLSVEDKISEHLPNTPALWKNITVRHLLTHTSGIKTYTGLDGFELTSHLTQQQFIEKIGGLNLDFQPGEKYSYCNTGYSLLGYIIENVSGKKYFEFMGEHIFSPLGMAATTNREPSIIVPNRADGYEKSRNGHWINRDYDLTDIFSAGAIISTVGDMAKWDVALNTSNILSDSSKQQMWTPTKLNNGSIKTYGFAWNVDTLEGHRNIWHSGSTSGFSASFLRLIDDHISVIVLCNSGESGIATAVAKKIALLYLPHSIAKN